MEKYNPFWFARWGVRSAQADAVDVLQCDTVLSGGISEGRKIAALASAQHISVSLHGDPHMAAYLLASLPNALIMETYPAVESQYNLALPPFPVKDGYNRSAEKAGSGDRLRSRDRQEVPRQLTYGGVEALVLDPPIFSSLRRKTRSEMWLDTTPEVNSPLRSALETVGAEL